MEDLILAAWTSESNKISLADFAKTNPKPEDILSIAHEIIKKYATPKDNIPKSEVLSKKAKKLNLNSDSEDDVVPAPPVNTVHANSILLIQDLLYIIELTDAISSGDFDGLKTFCLTLLAFFKVPGQAIILPKSYIYFSTSRRCGLQSLREFVLSIFH